MKLVLTALLLSLGLPAFGALPPYHDSAKQIQTVLSSDKAIDALGVGEAIESVSKLENLKYLLSTESNCSVTVQLLAHVPRTPGPTTYSVNQVSAVICDPYGNRGE